MASDSEARRRTETEPRSNPAGKRPLALHGREMLCHEKELGLIGVIFRLLRESLGAIILITDPDKVLETLRLSEHVTQSRQAL